MMFKKKNRSSVYEKKERKEREKVVLRTETTFEAFSGKFFKKVSRNTVAPWAH